MVAAVAVVTSLLYLASQIRQNTRQLRVSAQHASQSSLQETIAQQTDPDTAELLLRGFESFARLSPTEKFIFNGQMLNFLFDFMLSQTMADEGAFPESGKSIHLQWVLEKGLGVSHPAG